MSRHVGIATSPFVSVKLGVSPPGVAVCTAAAPFSSRDVVVKVDVDMLLEAFSSNSIIHLKIM